MARFLSPEWFDAANGVLSRLSVRPDVALIIEQRVMGGPDGDVTYCVILEAPNPRVEHDGPPGDIRLTLDYATAAGLGSGRLTVSDAMRAGKVRVTGDLARLRACASELAVLAEALAPLPTTY